MDTMTLSGISNAAAQVSPVSAPKPVAPVKAPARSSGANGDSPSVAKDTKSASKETSTYKYAPEETGPNDIAEKKSELPIEESLIELVSDSYDKGTKLKVDRDDDTGRVIFQTVMKETGEIIRQVPSEEMVALAKSMNLGNGVLVDKEA